MRAPSGNSHQGRKPHTAHRPRRALMAIAHTAKPRQEQGPDKHRQPQQRCTQVARTAPAQQIDQWVEQRLPRPRTDGGTRNQQPQRPEPVTAQHRHPHNGQRGPGGKQLPGIRPGLVGDANVGQQPAQGQGAQQYQRHP